MSDLRDILQKLANPNPHVKQMNVIETFIPEWVHITGFFDSVVITPEVRRIGLDNLVWYVKRRMATMLQDRCERGFDTVHAPWSRRFIGGHRCMRPFTDQEDDEDRAHYTAAVKAGRDPQLKSRPIENLCGPITAVEREAWSEERNGSTAANPGGEAAARSTLYAPRSTAVDAEVARLGELDRDSCRSETPSDRYAGWEPSQYVAWSIHLSETKLNAFFREATGVSARVVCDVMCARDAAHRIERAAEASLDPILGEILLSLREKAKVEREDSFAMTQLVNAARRAWNMHRRTRGWCPGERAVSLGYKNHQRLRDAFIWARLQTPDAIENAVLTRMLCKRLGIKPPAEAAPLPPNPAHKHFNESPRAPRAILALVRNPKDPAAAQSSVDLAPVGSVSPIDPMSPIGPIVPATITPADSPYKEDAPSVAADLTTMCADFSLFPELEAEIGAGI